jgi:hypothetical protein
VLDFDDEMGTGMSNVSRHRFFRFQTVRINVRKSAFENRAPQRGQQHQLHTDKEEEEEEEEEEQEEQDFQIVN